MFGYNEAGSKSLTGETESLVYCKLLKCVMYLLVVGPLMPILISTFIGYWIGSWTICRKQWFLFSNVVSDEQNEYPL